MRGAATYLPIVVAFGEITIQCSRCCQIDVPLQVDFKLLSQSALDAVTHLSGPGRVRVLC